MKQIQVPCFNHGYAFINGRLIECDVVRFDVCFTDDKVENHITVSHADWTEKIDPSDFYANIDDFRSGAVKTIITDNVWLIRYFRECNFGESASDNYTYIIENGRVKRYYFEISTISVFYKDGEIDYMESPDIPEVCWKIEDAAKSHLGVTIVNEDGSVTEIPSAASLVALTDEQRKVVDELVALSKKAQEMGVKIVGDWNGAYAFNTNNLTSWSLNYEDEGYERVDLLSDEFSIDMDVTMSSDENMLDIVRKDA